MINMSGKEKIFSDQLNELIRDFSKKKKRFYNGNIRLSWAIAIVNACVSFFLGLSFIDSIEIATKIVALFLSSVLLILNTAYSFLNYKNAYIQRTKTLIQLLSLRRQFQLKENNLSEKDVEEFSDKLEKIMQEDLDLWEESQPKEEK